MNSEDVSGPLPESGMVAVPISADALNSQLLRYAEDLQALLAKHTNLAQSHTELIASHVRLSQDRSTLEKLIHSSRDVYISTDLSGRIVDANPAALALFSANQLIEQSLPDLLPESERSHFEAIRVLAAKDPASSHETLFVLTPEGGPPRTLRTRVIMSPSQTNGQPPLLHWMLRDDNSGPVVDMENILSAMVFHNTAEGVMITDGDGVILRINPAFSRITGYSTEEAVGNSPHMLSSGLHSSQFYKTLWQNINEDGFWQGEVINRRKNGEHYSEWLTITSVHESNECSAKYVAVFSDVTPLHQNEKRLTFIAYHDNLTGLPNRAGFLDKLSLEISQARRSNQALTLMFIDLDGFKAINDNFGHKHGDYVLEQIANRLSASVRSSDIVARLGGDEFVVILPALSDKASVGMLARKLIESVSAPILLDGDPLKVGASIGCAVFPEHAMDDSTLLRHADKAMYEAKQAGGNTHVFFRAEADSALADDDEITTSITTAISHEQLEVFYQPCFDLRHEPPRLVGVEALLRWRHPTQGLLTPSSFLAVAERSGAISQIGEWMLRTSCNQVKTWQGSINQELYLSVKLFSRHLREANFVNHVVNALAESGFRANKLELDIFEHDAMSHIEGDKSRLQLLRSLGLHLSIADLGSQHCNLRRLKSLSLSRLKIGPDMVSAINLQPEAKAYCQAMVGIGAAYGIEVSAMGIDTADQLDSLRQLGCHFGQGIFFSPPMPGSEFTVWASHQRRLSNLIDSRLNRI
jgi:diguanylate cyclase (GGDEF)-like protein/PAS domain S-box-containing protein